MKRLLLNFIFLAILLPQGFGQISSPEGQDGNLKMVIKKYEVIETELYSADNLLVYANTELVFVGEEKGNIDLKKLKKPPQKEKKPVLSNQFLTAGNSILENNLLFKPDLFIDKDYNAPMVDLGFREQQEYAKDKNIHFGSNMNQLPSKVTPSSFLPERGTITKSPGYLTGVSFSKSLR